MMVGDFGSPPWLPALIAQANLASAEAGRFDLPPTFFYLAVLECV